jgi:uncharacterized damage-inducible protein DinB
MPSPSELIDRYLAGPSELRAAVAGMSGEQAAARPVAGRWSTLEVVCHLADFEPILADRMKRVIAMDKPLLMGADEDQFARRLAYEERDLDEELALIEVTRRQMGRVLRSLSAEAFERAGVHHERGLMTLAEVLGSAVRHVTHHVAFIRDKRQAMGLNA